MYVKQHRVLGSSVWVWQQNDRNPEQEQRRKRCLEVEARKCSDEHYANEGNCELTDEAEQWVACV